MAKRTSRSQANESTTAPREPGKTARTPRARAPRQQGEADPPPAPEPRADTGASQPTVSDAMMANPHAAGPEEAMPPAGASASPDCTTSTSMASEPSEEDIRLRAYHLFLERGGTHGAHEDDWHRAERELRSRRKAR